MSLTGGHMAIARILIGFALLFGSSASLAQTNDEMYSNLQFNFTNPGARSLSMGGAFVGRADDATAAWTNPAGLGWLLAREVGVEYKHSGFRTEFLEGASITGTPTGQGLDNGGRTRAFDASQSGLSYLAAVFPLKTGTLAVFRHEQANYEARIDQFQGNFFDTATGQRRRTEPLDSRFNVDVVNIGVAYQFPIGDNFHVGASIAHSDFELRAIGNRYPAIEDGQVITGPADFSLERLQRYERGDDNDWVYSLGVLWKSDSGAASIGASYRRGGRFDYDSELRQGRLIVGDQFPNVIAPDVSGPAEFEVPDIAAIGASYRFTEQLTFNFDVARVGYSSLTPNANYDGRVRDGFAELSDFRVEDATEVHAGFEYIHFVGDVALAFRGGAWLDPDHSMHYRGDDAVLVARFQEGKDEMHYSLGFGATIKDLEINAAADLSDRGDTYSMSALYRF